MAKKGKFKLLHKDLKPDNKLSAKLLELFRRVPVECSIAKIEHFFIYNFDIESAIKGLVDRCKKDIGNLYHITIESAEQPIFSGEVNPLEIPKNVKADLRQLWYRRLEDRWRIVSNIFRDCKVFKINENLYIVETLIKYEGCKYYVVKLDELAKKNIYTDDGGNKITEYKDAWRKSPVKTRKGEKKWVRILPKHPLILPEAVAVINKLTEDLIYEISNGKALMCSFSSKATKEAIKLITELRNNQEIWSIGIWHEEKIYNREIGLSEHFRLGEMCMAAIAPGYKVCDNWMETADYWKSPEGLKPFREAEWGYKGCMGLIVVENGYDVKAPYSSFLRLEEYYKWKKMFMTWGKLMGIPEKRLRTFYNL